MKRFRPTVDPLYPGGCFAILTGNLVPLRAVVKKIGVEPQMYNHTGTAVVFNSEEEVRDYLLNKKVEPESVLVIRYEGPQGGEGVVHPRRDAGRHGAAYFRGHDHRRTLFRRHPQPLRRTYRAGSLGAS
jgi:hypothetical protein